MRKIVKAEILWTRHCPYKCAYCGMPDPSIQRAPVEKMIEGVARLKALGCGLLVIYGASPLTDFEGLPEYIKAAEEMGVLTTLIFDGGHSKTKERLHILYEYGLRSFTMSYDAYTELTPHITKDLVARSKKGLELALWAKEEFPGLRDIQLNTTVTSQNWESLLAQLPFIFKKGFWFAFDIIHPDRGLPGTKCKGDAKYLRMSPPDLRKFARKLLLFKRQGGLVHQSEYFLKWMAENAEKAASFKWNCASKLWGTEDSFPGWLTVDADGTVRPCDDFCVTRRYKIWDLDEELLEDWIAEHKIAVDRTCPGCLWSTHVDALHIKQTGEGYNEYYHV